MKGMMLLEAVVKAVCESGGAVEYERLLELSAAGTAGAGPGEDPDLEAVVGNKDYFTVIQRNNLKQVLIRTSLKICRNRECDRTCKDLHLCRFYLLGHCGRRRCNYGHSLEAEHNSRVLRERSLHGLNIDQLRILLLQSDGFLLPQVCVSYNKGSGDFGNCPDKEACIRLHICESYIKGTCDGNGCNKSCHDLFEPHPVKTLEAKGVPSQLIGSLLVTYGNLLALKDHSNARVETGAKRRVDTKFNNKGRVPESLKKNAENLICLSFVKGFCKFGEQCRRIHFDMPYKWQVEIDQVWIDLPDNEEIERDYCDPAKIHSAGTEPVCFDTMVQGLHNVRRLSTDSSVVQPTFVLTTKWQWYWENEYRKWIQYASTLELERQYIQFLKDRNNAVVTFNAGKQFYKLNFQEMKQKNEMSGTERMVRRRPEFLSSYDVQRARTSRRGAQSSSHKGVPGFWDKTAIPDTGFQRVVLGPTEKDYIRVQEHFHKTIKNFSILKIERIQNKELWEDFQTKRERMKKANQDKKYAEGERFLFHGTRSTLIDPICLQNFDMRVSGANGTVYGQGSYFAKDARYSHDYTDNYGERYMFVCRVLVGHYTKGASHYRRPPAKDSLSTLFDSCVNDVRDPTIYVVFDKTQVYPEFLITYKETPAVNTFQPSVCTLAQSLAQSADITDLSPPSTPTRLAVISQRSTVSVSPYLTAATDSSVKSDYCAVPSPKTSLSGYTSQSENVKIRKASVSSCSSDVILEGSWNLVNPSDLDSQFSPAPNLSAESSSVKASSSSNIVHSDNANTQRATLPSQTPHNTKAKAASLLQDSKKESVNRSSFPELSFLDEDTLDAYRAVQRLYTSAKPAAVDHSAASSRSYKESDASGLYRYNSPLQTYTRRSLSRPSENSDRRSPPSKPQQKPKSDCSLL